MKIVRVVVLIAALGVVVLGLVGGVAGLLLGLLHGEDRLTAVTFGVSVLVLTVGGGVWIAWHTWQAIQGRSSPPFRPRRVWWLLLAFGLALGLGQAVLTFDLLPLLTFPFLHVAAALLPALAIVGLVGWWLDGAVRQREMVWQLGSGALLSTFLAGVLEAAALGGLLIAVILITLWQPGGAERLERLASLLENATQNQQADLIIALLHSPGAVVAVLLVAAGLIPLLEEGIKTVGAVFLIEVRRPRLPQAFLWGVGSGAGFALTEALINSIGGLEAWGFVALIRSGATLLHCTTGGLMGLAWYFLLLRGRWGWALGLYGASVGIHALWNLLTVVISILSLTTLDGPGLGPGQIFAGLGILGAMTLLGLLVLLMAGVLAGSTWYLRRMVRQEPREACGHEIVPSSSAPLSRTEYP